MTHAVTPKILQHISKLISRGQPIWGMLWANEYLRNEPEIRQAYLAKVGLQLNGTGKRVDPELLRLVSSGCTMVELPSTLQTWVREERELPNSRGWRTNRLAISQKPWRALRESNLRKRAVGYR